MAHHEPPETLAPSPAELDHLDVANHQDRKHSTQEPSADAPERPLDDNIHTQAASLIQRNYRGYRARRQLRGLDLGTSTRWEHAISDARFREINRPRPLHESFPLAVDTEEAAAQGDISGASHAADGTPNPARVAAQQRWKKAITVARRVGADVDSDYSSDEDSSSDLGRDDPDRMSLQESGKRRRKLKDEEHLKASRHMGLRYFLEMVDLKHRHGSNLGKYHQEWLKSDTKENFFYWLDHGAGKDVDLEICPREKLDQQQVRYLSREERQHYLVKVDREGRLVWAKNGMKIDTTDEWKDTVHGIVPADDPTPAIPAATDPVESQEGQEKKAQQANVPQDLSGSGSDISDSDSNGDQNQQDNAAQDTEYRIIRRVKDVSAGTIFKRLIRKQPRKNTWLFVADTSFRLYVGIKSGGVFQHSSFLQGARIAAAGLIKIRNGRITSLSPLSGHYRPPAANFRAFVHSLEDAGVDMTHVSITKSYAVLVGLEAYIKTQQKGKKAARAMTAKEEIYVPGEVPREKPRHRTTNAQTEDNTNVRNATATPSAQPSKKEKTLEPVTRLLQKLGIHRRRSSRNKDLVAATAERSVVRDAQ